MTRQLKVFVIVIGALLVGALHFGASSHALAQPNESKDQPSTVARVGVVLDGADPRTESFLLLVQGQLKKFMGKARVEFLPAHQISGDFSLASAQANLKKLQDNPDVDLIWAFGLQASQAAFVGRDPMKPVLAPFVVQVKEGKGGKPTSAGNLSYIQLAIDPERDLRTFRELVAWKHLAFVADARYLDLPGVASSLQQVAKKLGFRLKLFPVEDDPEVLTKAQLKEVDALYLGPTPRFTREALSSLARLLVKKGIPSFSQIGKGQVLLGFLAGLGSEKDVTALQRQILVNSDAILRGEEAHRLRTAFRLSEHLVVNMATSRSLEKTFAPEMLAEAELLFALKTKISRRLTLQSVTEEVLKRNLDLLSNEQDLRVANEARIQAQARLLPRLEASLSGSWIDTDRASVSNPELGASYKGSLSQSLFDESLWAGFAVQKHLIRATEHGNASARLDAIQAAASSYFNVLRATKTEEIQRDNLRTTRSNLELARVRVKVGSATRSEVVRLETSLVTARRDLVVAIAQRNLAEMGLNRLLNRPIDERFILQEVEAKDSRIFGGKSPLASYWDDTLRFSGMTGFFVDEALGRAPELQSLTARSAAKRREQKSYRNSLFLPSVNLQASLGHRFWEGGTGANDALPPGSALPDDLDAQIGITASLPLFEGGARYSRRREAGAQIDQLGLQASATKQLIEQNVRSALTQAQANYRAVRLSRSAASLAKENLDLVTAEYGQGKAGVVQLLDAQNQAVVSDFSVNTAVYNFMGSLMDVQRSTGQFEFTMSDADITALRARLAVHERKRAAGASQQKRNSQ